MPALKMTAPRLVTFLLRRLDVSQRRLSAILGTTPVQLGRIKSGAATPRKAFASKLELLAAAVNHQPLDVLEPALLEVVDNHAVYMRTLCLLSLGHDPRAFGVADIPFIVEAA